MALQLGSAFCLQLGSVFFLQLGSAFFLQLDLELDLDLDLEEHTQGRGLDEIGGYLQMCSEYEQLLNWMHLSPHSLVRSLLDVHFSCFFLMNGASHELQILHPAVSINPRLPRTRARLKMLAFGLTK